MTVTLWQLLVYAGAMAALWAVYLLEFVSRTAGYPARRLALPL